MSQKQSKVAACWVGFPEDIVEKTSLFYEDYCQSALLNNLSVVDHPDLIPVLLKVWAFSDFVAQSCLRHPQDLAGLLDSGDLFVNYTPDYYRKQLQQQMRSVDDDAELEALFRQFRRREMIRIAWRDLAGWAPLDEVLLDLSTLAETMLDLGLQWLDAHQRREIGIPYGENGEPQSLVVLGMGKLGAGELNFSSDIDLIFAFPDVGEVVPVMKGVVAISNEEYFMKLGRRLIKLFDEPQELGFVFRVDMRLRPYGKSGPLVMSFESMEEYYQNHGRDWERYAFIKARVVAGDIQAGKLLMKSLQPFVYRRYLDYGAFDSLREMKQLIEREVQRLNLQGNIKLGLGGIREIEFIGQAFQLIRGGREKPLQTRPIQQVLKLLGRAGYLGGADVDTLLNAYAFLRKVENRIQMHADEQLHVLPGSESRRICLALACGYSTWKCFVAALERETTQVHAIFQKTLVIPQESQWGQIENCWIELWAEGKGNEGLVALGFHCSEAVLHTITAFKASTQYHGLSARARQRLDRVMPIILKEIGGFPDTEGVFSRVFPVIEAIASRSAYIALLIENPGALKRLVKLCSASAWLAELLADWPVLFDELLDEGRMSEPLNKAGLRSELSLLLDQVSVGDLEQQMEVLRYFKSSNVMRISIADILGYYPLMEVSDHLTEIAEVVLERVLTIAWDHLVGRHGVPKNTVSGQVREAGFAIVGYGKLGGKEMGYGSDLDIVFLHDSDVGAVTDGRQPIENIVFFTRLSQRIGHILSTQTTLGVLYEVDLRLRPSGNSGLLVANVNGFSDYQHNDAWTWEHQALVRARYLCGHQEAGRQFNEIREQVLIKPRDKKQLVVDVVEMREKMKKELGSKKKDVFDIKQDSGGVVDVEFIVQYLVLAYAQVCPNLLKYTDNIRILQVCEQTGLLKTEQAGSLATAFREYRKLLHQCFLQGKGRHVNPAPFEEKRALVSHLWAQLAEGRL